MDNETHLHLLRLLQRQPNLSQRQLAQTLGISLGKTNYCLRALIEKGWVKTGNFTRNRNKAAYLYLLTPRGLAGKAHLTLRFLCRKEAEHAALIQEIDELRQQVADDTRAKSVNSNNA